MSHIPATEHPICDSYSLYSAKFIWEVYDSEGHVVIPEHIIITTDRVEAIMDRFTFDIIHAHACKDTHTCIHVSEKPFNTTHSFKEQFIDSNNNTYTIVFTRITTD